MTLANKICFKRKTIADAGHQWFQILAITLGSVSSFVCGIATSWTSPSIQKLQSDAEYNLSSDEMFLLAILLIVGAFISCPIIQIAADIIGRKYILIVVMIPVGISWVLIAVSTSTYVLYAARIMAGLIQPCIYTVLPIYVGEIAAPNVRGTWGNLVPFSFYLGMAFINVVGTYATISMTAYICLAVSLFFTVTFCLMPKSPYFLLMKNQDDEARRSLQKFRQTSSVDAELMIIKDNVDKQMAQIASWTDLIKTKSNRRALIAILLTRICQPVSGIAGLIMYTQQIFIDLQEDMSTETGVFLSLSLLAFMILVSSLIMDTFGRKKCFFWSSLICGLSDLVLSAHFYIGALDYISLPRHISNWILLGAVVTFVVSFSLGIGSVPTLLFSELLPVNIKSKCSSVASLSSLAVWLGAMVVFRLSDSIAGLSYYFLVCGILCLIFSVTSLYVIPETKGKTLEEIQEQLKME